MNEKKIITSGDFKEKIKILNKLKAGKNNIVFIGESGTGKTFLTRYYHKISSRRNFPLIEINLSSIPEELMESTLFGYERGSFTGAIENRKGILENADRGIVVFENIEDISIISQAKLLKFLEDMKIIPVGSIKSVKLDLIIISHFKRNPYHLIREKKLREDLFFRLNGITIPLSPFDMWMDIEEKKKFIMELFKAISEKERRNLKLTHGVLNEISRLSFKGNIRELETFLKSLFYYIPKRKKIIREIPESILNLKEEIALKTLQEVEREYIIKILKFTGGNKSKASKILGISRKGLIEKCKKFGIKI